MSTYDEVVGEVANDLGIAEDELRRVFFAWLAKTGANTKPEPHLAHACYAVYRLTKLKGALRSSHRSREGWKARAMALGSPPHLVESLEPTDEMSR
jgi:hypothetical protein